MKITLNFWGVLTLHCIIFILQTRKLRLSFRYSGFTTVTHYQQSNLNLITCRAFLPPLCREPPCPRKVVPMAGLDIRHWETNYSVASECTSLIFTSCFAAKQLQVTPECRGSEVTVRSKEPHPWAENRWAAPPTPGPQPCALQIPPCSGTVLPFFQSRSP